MSGGQSSSPSETKVTQTTLPEYVQPYFESLLNRTEGASQRPYAVYPGQVQADISPDTWVAQQQVRDIQGIEQPFVSAGINSLAPLSGIASNLANYQAPDITSNYQMPTGYAPNNYQSSYTAPGGYNPTNFTNSFNFDSSQYTNPIGFGIREISPQSVGTTDFPDSNLDAYMSPYMQQVIENQKIAARQAFQEGQNARDEGAIRSGAFGGYRNAIERGVAERGLERNLSDIEGAGRQAAYSQAMQQFNQDMARRLQADTTTAGLNFSAQQSNQGADLEAQKLAELSRQYGGNIGLQAAQYGGLYGLQTQQMSEAARQYAANLANQQAQFGSQADLAAAQLREQSGQFGAGLGSQQGMFGAQNDLQAQMAYANALRDAAQVWGLGGQFGLQGAQAYGGLGQLAQQMGLTGSQALSASGAQQQAYDQQALDIARQEFENQRDYENQMIQFYGSILHGVPVSPSSNITQYQSTNPLAQMAGLGLAGLSAYKMFQ